MGDRVVSKQQWHVAAASVRGASHERSGLPCQDAHVWAVSAQGLLVAAVADGAGSAPLASEGAELAATRAVERLVQRVDARKITEERESSPANDGWNELLFGALGAAREALETEANKRAVPLKELATTLSVLAAGNGFVAASQIGDGALIVANEMGTLESLATAAPTEYLNETLFLTSDEALKGAVSAVWRGQLAHLALLSDGLRMVALRMPGGEPHVGFFTPLFQFMQRHRDGKEASRELAEFLSSARLRERTDDDVTLVMASVAR